MMTTRIHIMGASGTGTSTLEAALAPDGRQHANQVAFLEWAAAYDEGDVDMRSLARHRLWLDTLPCPVARFEEEMQVTDLLKGVLRVPKKKENR